MPATALARSPDAAADGAFDVVVVGGGIYGAFCAVEAAARGLRTLLVERADFGGGATFNSLRTIHGGLRYLQRLDVARARTSAWQRAWWLQTFPDLIAPVSCLMPLYGRGLARPTVFRAAFGLLRALRIDGPPVLPAPRVLTPAEVRERAPIVGAVGLRGGALWSDAFVTEAPRLLIETLRWAAAQGAVLLNHAELTSVAPEPAAAGSRLRILDRVSGLEMTVRARTVINAAGAAVDEVARRLGTHERALLRPTLAWNVLLDVPASSHCSLAVACPTPGAHVYFLHPFHGRVLAGTGHAPAVAGTAVRPSEAQLERMREDLETALPGAGLGRAAVLRVLAGVLPGVRAGSDGLAMRPLVVRGVATGGAAVWHVRGVKLTETPVVAREVLDEATGSAGGPLPPRPAAATGWNVIGGPPVTRDALLALAASESAVYVDDVVERRTNAWCDERAKKRVEALVNGALRSNAAQAS